jgi:hypothetical protein
MPLEGMILACPAFGRKNERLVIEMKGDEKKGGLLPLFSS